MYQLEIEDKGRHWSKGHVLRYQEVKVEYTLDTMSRETEATPAVVACSLPWPLERSSDRVELRRL